MTGSVSVCLALCRDVHKTSELYNKYNILIKSEASVIFTMVHTLKNIYKIFRNTWSKNIWLMKNIILPSC
jgi:hypothetical protein